MIVVGEDSVVTIVVVVVTVEVREHNIQKDCHVGTESRRET